MPYYWLHKSRTLIYLNDDPSKFIWEDQGG